MSDIMDANAQQEPANAELLLDFAASDAHHSTNGPSNGNHINGTTYDHGLVPTTNSHQKESFSSQPYEEFGDFGGSNFPSNNLFAENHTIAPTESNPFQATTFPSKEPTPPPVIGSIHSQQTLDLFQTTDGSSGPNASDHFVAKEAFPDQMRQAWPEVQDSYSLDPSLEPFGGSNRLSLNERSDRQNQGDYLLEDLDVKTARDPDFDLYQQTPDAKYAPMTDDPGLTSSSFMKELSPDCQMKDHSLGFYEEPQTNPFMKEPSPENSLKYSTPEPFVKESSPEPYMKQPSPAPFVMESPYEPFMGESSLDPYAKEPSAEPCMKELSPEPFTKDSSPEPFMKDSSPEPFMKDSSPDHFMKDSSPEPSMKEPSPDPFMKDYSPEPFMKERSPEPFIKEPSLEPLMKEQSPAPFTKDQSPEPTLKEITLDPFKKEPSPQSFMNELTQEPFIKEPSPESFVKDSSPEPSSKEPSPDPFMKELSPESFKKEASPEPIMKETSSQPCAEKLESLTEPHVSEHFSEPSMEEHPVLSLNQSDPHESFSKESTPPTDSLIDSVSPIVETSPVVGVSTPASPKKKSPSPSKDAKASKDPKAMSPKPNVKPSKKPSPSEALKTTPKATPKESVKSVEKVPTKDANKSVKPPVPKVASATAPKPRPASAPAPKSAPMTKSVAAKSDAAAPKPPKPAVPKAPRSAKTETKSSTPPASATSKDPPKSDNVVKKPEARKATSSPSRIATRKPGENKQEGPSKTSKTATTPPAKASAAPPSKSATARASSAKTAPLQKSSTPERKTPDRTSSTSKSKEKPEWDWTITSPAPKDKKLPPAPKTAMSADVSSKIGSKDNLTHTPGGGKVKIESKKLAYKETAKSRVGSLENATHKPKGGEKKIESRKLEWKGESKVGSMDNATHKPGGGTKKRLGMNWFGGGSDTELLLGDGSVAALAGTCAFYAAILDGSSVTIVGKVDSLLDDASFGTALLGSTVTITGQVRDAETKDAEQDNDKKATASSTSGMISTTISDSSLAISGRHKSYQSKLENARVTVKGTSVINKKKEASLDGAVLLILDDDNEEKTLLLDSAKLTVIDSEGKQAEIRDFGFVLDGVPLEFESRVGEEATEGSVLKNTALKLHCANPATALRQSDFEISGKIAAKKKTKAFDRGLNGLPIIVSGKVGEEISEGKLVWSNDSVSIPLKDGNMKMHLKCEKESLNSLTDRFAGSIKIDAKEGHNGIVDLFSGSTLELSGSTRRGRKGTDIDCMKFHIKDSEGNSDISLDGASIKFGDVDDRITDGASFVITGSVPEVSSPAAVLVGSTIAIVGTTSVTKDDGALGNNMNNVRFRIDGSLVEADSTSDDCENARPSMKDPNGVFMNLKDTKIEIGGSDSNPEFHNARITIVGKPKRSGASINFDDAEVYVTDRNGENPKKLVLTKSTVTCADEDGKEKDPIEFGKMMNGSQIRLSGIGNSTAGHNLQDVEVAITGIKGVSDVMDERTITVQGKAKVPKSTSAYNAGLNDAIIRVHAIMKEDGSELNKSDAKEIAFTAPVENGIVVVNTKYEERPSTVGLKLARIEVVGKNNGEMQDFMSGAKFSLKGEAKRNKTGFELKNATFDIQNDTTFALTDATFTLDDNDNACTELNRLILGATFCISGTTPAMTDTSSILDQSSMTISGKVQVTSDRAKLGKCLSDKTVVIHGAVKFISEETELCESDSDVKDPNVVKIAFADLQMTLDDGKDIGHLDGSSITLKGHPVKEAASVTLNDATVWVKKGRKINKFSIDGATVAVKDGNGAACVDGLDEVFNGSDLNLHAKCTGSKGGEGSGVVGVGFTDASGCITGARGPKQIITNRRLVISGKAVTKKGTKSHETGLNGTQISIIGSVGGELHAAEQNAGNVVHFETGNLSIKTAYSDMDSTINETTVKLDDSIDPDYLNGVSLEMKNNGRDANVVVKRSDGDFEFILEKVSVELQDGAPEENEELKRHLVGASWIFNGNTEKLDSPVDLLTGKEIGILGTIKIKDGKGMTLDGKTIEVRGNVGNIVSIPPEAESNKKAGNKVSGSFENVTGDFSAGDLNGSLLELRGKIDLEETGDFTLNEGTVLISKRSGKDIKSLPFNDVKITVKDANSDVLSSFECSDLRITGKIGAVSVTDSTKRSVAGATITFTNVLADRDKFAYIMEHDMEISGLAKALPGCSEGVAALEDKKIIVRGRCDEKQLGPTSREPNPNRIDLHDSKITMLGKDGTQFECKLRDAEFEVEGYEEVANILNGAKVILKKCDKKFIVSIAGPSANGELSFKTAHIWFEGPDPDKMLRIFMTSLATLEGRTVPSHLDADGCYRAADLAGTEIEISGKGTGSGPMATIDKAKIKIINKNQDGQTSDADFTNAAIVVEGRSGSDLKGKDICLKGKVVQYGDELSIADAKIQVKGEDLTGARIYVSGVIKNGKNSAKDLEGVGISAYGTQGVKELENANLVVRGPGQDAEVDEGLQEFAEENASIIESVRTGGATASGKDEKRSSQTPEFDDEEITDDMFEVDEFGNFLRDDKGRRILKKIFNERLNWDAQKKVDTWNPNYKPSVIEKKKMFHEDLEWKSEKKVSTFNKDYKPGGGTKKVVVNQKLKWEGKSRLNTGLTKPAVKTAPAADKKP